MISAKRTVNGLAVHGTIYEFESLPHFAQPETRVATRHASRPASGPAVPLVGIIRNPRSHRNKTRAPELADCSNILTETPRTRSELRETLTDFARRGIDYLVVDGGDGTVRDVLTCGGDIFGERWPALIVLPKGKTNALTVDLGLPNTWSLTEALVAAQRGNTVERRPLRITQADRAEGCVQGFLLGAGAFTLGTEVGQEAHRRGAFNSFAIGLIIFWGIVQTLFGRAGNPWRACTPMRMRHWPDGAELPFSRHERKDERFIMVATTFERFPLGARPFGRDVRPGLKLGLIDWPHRWLMALLPAVLAGFYPRFLARKGAHRVEAEAVELELGGAFILDGEAFPAGRYLLQQGPRLSFVVP